MPIGLLRVAAMFTFTFYDLLAKNLSNRGSHPMIVDGCREVTYAEIAREVDRAAAWLNKVGIRRGDRVGVDPIWRRNSLH